MNIGFSPTPSIEFLGILLRAALLGAFWQQMNLAYNAIFPFSSHLTDFGGEIANFQV